MFRCNGAEVQSRIFAVSIGIGYGSGMDLDARPYRAFLAVADSGSFSRAAGLLHVSQPALSAQIKEFERRLGFQLFARSSRKVILTTEGRLFIDRARRLVAETEGAMNAARDIRTNQLRIGAAHHTSEIEERNALIYDFAVSAPDVPLRVLRRSPSQLHDDLESGAVDVAIQLEFKAHADDAVAAPAHERRVLASRPLRLWVPAADWPAEPTALPASCLDGIPVGMIDRSHGVALAEGVGGMLRAAGAILRTLPEGDAQAVRRQCARLGICAVDLGWYPAEDDRLCSRAVEGWSAQTIITVTARKGERRDGARRFLQSLPARAFED